MKELSFPLRHMQFLSWEAEGKYWFRWVANGVTKIEKCMAVEKLQPALFIEELLVEAGYIKVEISDDKD
jgi:hypothetical protein